MLTDIVGNWMERNCFDGQMPSIVRDLLAEARSKSVGFAFVLGQRRTKDRHAYLVQGFGGELFCFHLTPRQVAQLQLEENFVGGALGVSTQPWTPLEDPMISLDRVVLAPPSPLQNAQHITGTAWYHLLRQPPVYDPLLAGIWPPEADPMFAGSSPQATKPDPFKQQKPTAFPMPPSTSHVHPFFPQSPGGHPMHPETPRPAAGAMLGFEHQPSYALALSFAVPNGFDRTGWHYIMGLSSEGSIRFSFSPFADKNPATHVFRGPIVLFFRMVYVPDPHAAVSCHPVSHTLAELVDLAGDSSLPPRQGLVQRGL